MNWPQRRHCPQSATCSGLEAVESIQCQSALAHIQSYLNKQLSCEAKAITVWGLLPRAVDNPPVGWAHYQPPPHIEMKKACSAHCAPDFFPSSAWSPPLLFYLRRRENPRTLIERDDFPAMLLFLLLGKPFGGDFRSANLKLTGNSSSCDVWPSDFKL